MREQLIEKINQRLKPVGLSFEKLEQEYGDDVVNHVIIDLKGVSIWFNASYMEMFKRNYLEYLTVDFVNISLRFNSEHPFTSIFIDMLQNQPKEMKCKFFI